MRLTKGQQAKHAEAMALVDAGRPLTFAEREFVADHYREDAVHLNGLAGAYFTPTTLANDFALHVPDEARVLDLCAGAGALSRAVGPWDESLKQGARELVCVEANLAYVRVGKALLPEAIWVLADAFDARAYRHYGPFDVVISNPPFGNVKMGPPAPAAKYMGSRFEFRLIEHAKSLAGLGVFIVPQTSAPFKYSGQSFLQRLESGPAVEFSQLTGIPLKPGIGVDTDACRGEWHGTSPKTEIVVCDFDGRHG